MQIILLLILQIYCPRSAVACCHCEEMIALTFIPDHLHACPILHMSDVRLNTSTGMGEGTAAEADQPQPQPPQDMNDGGITADQRNYVNQVTMDLSASNPLSIAGEPDQLESSCL